MSSSVERIFFISIIFTDPNYERSSFSLSKIDRSFPSDRRWIWSKIHLFSLISLLNSCEPMGISSSLPDGIGTTKWRCRKWNFIGTFWLFRLISIDKREFIQRWNLSLNTTCSSSSFQSIQFNWPIESLRRTFLWLIEWIGIRHPKHFSFVSTIDTFSSDAKDSLKIEKRRKTFCFCLRRKCWSRLLVLVKQFDDVICHRHRHY